MTKLAIATPIDGLPESALVSFGYAKAIASILASKLDVGMLDPGLLGYPSDLVRARSRAVRLARDFGATHVLWLDQDTIPAQGALGAMLESGHDVIGCPYPRKRIHWNRVGVVMPGEEPEWHAYEYAYHMDTHKPEGVERVECVNGCIAVERLSMGCMLTSMRALDAMWDFYKEEQWFTDVVDGRHYDCVALFGLMMTERVELNGRPWRTLLSEDYSFCERYNRYRLATDWERARDGAPPMGPIQMLVSHPADHVGQHLFRGNTHGLVYAR